MTRWVRWDAGPWHVFDIHDGKWTFSLCSNWTHRENPTMRFSDFEPVEDECRHCRRALDGKKT